MHIYSYTHDTHILILTNLKCQSDLWGFYIFVITKIVKYLIFVDFFAVDLGISVNFHQIVPIRLIYFQYIYNCVFSRKRRILG